MRKTNDPPRRWLPQGLYASGVASVYRRASDC